MSSEAQQQSPGNQEQENVRIETTPQADVPETMGHYSYGIFKRPLRFDPLAIIFALLVFAGGITGYVNKNSSASLIAGTIFAILLGITIYIEGARRNPYPLIVCLLALTGMMLYRYFLSGNFMPSGLTALLSGIMLLRHVYLAYLRHQVASSAS